MKEKWCEIFKIGTHKDSKGNIYDWTQNDLEKMKSNFENIHNAVPICCGHPKTNSPAYGWFDKLKTENGSLWATFKGVLPEFKEAYAKGLFKNRSLSLSPDLTIRHLAFLGAQAPAIKGLEQFCFSEEDENTITIEFGDINQTIDNEPAQAAMIGAQKVFPNLEEQEGAKMIEEMQKLLDEKDEKISKLQAALKKNEDEAKIKEFADWTDEMIKEGHILPSQKNMVIDILSAVQDTNFNFEDGSSHPEKSLKEFISSIKQIEFADIANRKNADEPKTIDFSDSETVKDAILDIQAEYKKKGIILTTEQAYNKIKGA